MAWGTPLTGANESLQIIKEAAFNTTPSASPKGHKLPLISHGLGYSRDKGGSRVLWGTPNPTKNPRGLKKAGGQIVMPVGIKSFGLMSYFLMTEYAKAGDDAPYTHTFKIGTTAKKSFAAETWNAKGGASSTGAGDVLLGCMLSSLEIPLRPVSEELTATFQVQGTGKVELNNTTQIDGTPDTYLDEEWCLAMAHKVQIGGTDVSYVIDGAIRIEQELEVIKAVDGTLYAAYVIPKRFRVSGNLACLIDNSDTARALATGEGETSIALIAAAPVTAGHSVSVYLDEVFVEVTNVPALNDTGHREINLEWDAFYEDGANASAARIVVVNAIADYAAIT